MKLNPAARKFFVESGKKGGEKTRDTKGIEHYSRIGKIGAKARKAKLIQFDTVEANLVS